MNRESQILNAKYFMFAALNHEISGVKSLRLRGRGRRGVEAG
jgi:hypothetical protein